MQDIKHPSFHAKTRPEKIAYEIAETGESITYAELDAASNRGAHLLRSLGIGPAGHVALLIENSLDLLRVCWSAQRSGVFYTAISTHLKAAEVAYIVADCDARVLFVSAHLLAPLLQELPLRDGVLRVVTTGAKIEGFDFYDDLCAKQPVTPIADEVSGRDLLYSSGTTGRPKGVELPFEGEPLGTLMPIMRVLGEQMCGIDGETRYLSPAPLYHAAPLRFNMLCGSVGATAIVMKKFDAERYLRLIETHRITHTQVVPTMFVRMLKLEPGLRANFDVSSLRAVVHAAAPCPEDVKQAMIDWWGPILIEYYAGTEGNGVTIIDSHEWLAHRGSVGKALLGELKILGEDKNGDPLPAGQVGEVYFAGGNAFAYLNAPEQTAQAHNERGWSTLGDVGFLDEEGYLYLTDRKSYTIISGGVNIYPQETENVLIGHPAVADVAVFGVPHEEMGEAVKAVVQRAASDLTDQDLEAELIAYCKERLSSIKSPASVDFITDMPRTPTGKLIKRHLRDRYWPVKARV